MQAAGNAGSGVATEVVVEDFNASDAETTRGCQLESEDLQNCAKEFDVQNLFQQILAGSVSHDALNALAFVGGLHARLAAMAGTVDVKSACATRSVNVCLQDTLPFNTKITSLLAATTERCVDTEGVHKRSAVRLHF